jgi:peptidoglycan/LPS O-acetylase OafA/YrhL
MPMPARAGQRYLPGLDGLRGVAVLAFVASGLGGLTAVGGGLVSLTAAFTLSGYLITSVLLSEWSATGRLHLGHFWLGRARRLLPALFAMLAVVTSWNAVARLPHLRAALGDLWPLAALAEFYLVWPSLLMLGLLLLRRRRGGGVASVPAAARRLVLPAMMLAAAVALVRPGPAFGILIGAALALTCTGLPAGRRARLLLDVAGVAGIIVLGLLVCRPAAPGTTLIASVATAVVIGAVASPGSLAGWLLGWGPLRWIGTRSYGIFLWYLGLAPVADPLIRACVAVVLAAISWRFVEEPVRRGSVRARHRRRRPARLAPTPVG